MAGVLRRICARATASARERSERGWAEAAARPAPTLANAERHRLRAAFGAAPFFFDARDPELRARFRARHAAAAERLVAQADAALAGDLSFVVPGGTTDWHRALPGASRWPLVPADRLPISDATPPGDVRLAWEVGRCTHLVRLAQAAWITGERRYGDAAAAGLRSFAAENPPGLGIAWAHAQETALRAVAWLFTFRLLEPGPSLDAETFAVWLRGIRLDASHARAFLSDSPVTHNHLISEAFGLFVVGSTLAALPEADDWRACGRRILEREIRKQTFPEGTGGEHSTHYLAFVLDSAVAAGLAAERSGAPLAHAVRERIGATAGAIAALLRSDGTLPAIGDTDAGRAWRLGADPLDRRDVVAAAAALLGSAELGAAAGDAAGAFWITGGREVPGAGAPARPVLPRIFRDAGFAIARAGAGQREEVAIFRAGPTARRPDVLESHAHADALSVAFRFAGREVLLDPGTYLYSEAEGWRAALRGTRAHSTVVLDGREQADVRTQRFGIRGLELAHWLESTGGPAHLAAAAEHPAGRSPRVRRRVFWAAGGVLLLCDDAIGPATSGEVRFTLPASRGDVAGGDACLDLEHGLQVRIQPLLAAWVRVERPDPGRPAPGAWSPRFGVVRAGTSVAVTPSEAGPWRCATAVRVGEGRCPDPVVSHLDSRGDLVVQIAGRRVTFPSGGGILHEETA